ncbi:heavy metal translocating P-type ATPase [Nocardioides sp.]|uniref:heavy metal translocating P-type ATPase n=1 Tax=Nocardioides sp. TaxID=35761 RepID=UPI002603FD9B|nr:heavy metal translocating P-type ATPase [Nocardioides sp.]
MTTDQATPQREVDLAVTGMTCASCVGRVEKALNALDGVSATVNLPLEKAHVEAPADFDLQRLVQAVESAGYSATLPVEPSAVAEPVEAGPDPSAVAEAQTRQRLIVSAILTIPVVAMAMIPALQFDNWQWASLTLAAPVAVWGAWPFHRSAWRNARHGATTMDTLVSVGVLAAFGWSLYALFFGHAGMLGMHHSFTWRVERTDGLDAIYLEAAAGVTTLILAGKYAEARAKRRAGAALRALLDLGAKDVAVLRDGVETRMPIGELAVGDLFVVRPGDKVASDGEVVEGASAVDLSMLTGESMPVEVGVGSAVVGGTINSGGRLVVRATAVGRDTQLAQMALLVEQAQTGKAEVQRLADRVAAVFVPVVFVLALATLLGWGLIDGSWSVAFSAAVAVLIVACPCALGLATPIGLLVGTGRGAQLGIVIKGPQVLESTRVVDTVVLDKTGTVTTGVMAVVGVQVARGVEEADVLRRAAAVESGSEHPIGRAIVAAFDGVVPAVTGFVARAGVGVEGTVEGLDVSVVRSPAAGDQTAVDVVWDGRWRGTITLADTLKPTSVEALDRLRALGLRPLLVTGDARSVALAVAAEVGIPESDVVAEVMPGDKVDVVRRLQGEGHVVAMVGDGVNDAAALATADLGIALGTGTEVAIEASDLTLVGGDLRKAADAIRLSRRTLATIKGNLFWAFAYNVLAIPLAMAGLLQPMIAGAAMAFSSVFVIGNSLRLRSFK